MQKVVLFLLTCVSLKAGFEDDLRQFAIRSEATKGAHAIQTYASVYVGFEYDSEGHKFQCAIYASGASVATVLEGPHKGFQIMLSPEGELLDSSRAYHEHDTYFSHIYSWGEIKSYPNYQTITIH